MKLPTLDECEALMKKYGVPQNIRAHTEYVRKVANYLAQRIAVAGRRVDLDCVDRAAFLHDLMKLYCINNNCRHALEAEKALALAGFAEFGNIVRMHGLEEILRFDSSTPLEGKIVWYADKRVNHDTVVSLRARYDYLKEQYGLLNKEKMAQIVSTEKPAFALERSEERRVGKESS